MDIDEAQSNRRGEYVAKSKLAYEGVAKQSTRSTDHVTRSDQHDQQFHDREDDRI